MTTEQLLWLMIALQGLISLLLLLLWLNKPKDNIKYLETLEKGTRELGEKVIEKHSDIKLFINNELNNKNRQSTLEMIAFSDKIQKSLEDQIERINRRVDEKLGTGFDQTNRTFNEVVERLSKIDAAQKQIEKLSGDVVSLNDILNDKKTRGTFGEIQLKQLFSAVFGESKPSIYELQKKLDNETMVDVLLHAPDPMGDLCIDSKFPLENYRKMIDSTLNESERMAAEKAFTSDIKKHMDSIATKYIIPGITADQAIMFIPAEAIYAEIISRHEDLILYGQQKRVWLTSPTTLMSTLTVIQVVLRDIERNKYAKDIQKELTKLATDFERYSSRWEQLLKNLDTVSKTAKEVNVSSTKIAQKFKTISNVEGIDEPENHENTESASENE